MELLKQKLLRGKMFKGLILYHLIFAGRWHHPPVHERLGASRNWPMGLAEAIPGTKCEKLIFSSKNLEIFRTCPNASRCIRMHPNASEHVRAGPSKSENLEKLAKTSKTLRKLRENFAKTSRKFSRRLVLRDV